MSDPLPASPSPPQPPHPPIALVLADDRFVPGTLPLTDRGFRYGMSFFETLALHRGRTLFLTEHLGRLERAAAPFNPPATWRAAAAALLREPPIPDGVARIYITAGDGPPTTEATAPRVAALLEGIPPLPRSLPLVSPSGLLPRAEAGCPEPSRAPVLTNHQSPITLRSAEFTPAPLPAVKTANYWPHIAARQTAQAAGADDAILTRPDGRMISGSMSNVFFLRGTQLLTPPLADGPRDGVIRAWVMRNFPTTEETFTLADLPHLTAAFLTNSRLGIQEISRIDNHPLASSALVTEITATYHRDILDAH